jgi:hypothetical protein
MDNIPRQKLREIILQYGRSLCDDPKRCEAFLQDFCGQYRKEVSVLIIALKERIPANLLASPNSIPPVVLLARLTKRLQENVSLTEDAARWAVESWGLALGVISEADIASIYSSSPTPPQENINQGPSSPPVTQADKNQSINNNVKISRSNNLISSRPPAFLIPASERIKFVRSFTLWTIIGTLPIGFVMSLYIWLGSAGLAGLNLLLHLLLLVIAILLFGITVGVAQWFVLRRYLPLSKRWIFATIIGLFSMIFNIIPLFIFPGILQWIVLKKHIKNAWGWIFISAGVLMTSTAVYFLEIGLMILSFYKPGTMLRELGFIDALVVGFVGTPFFGFSYGFS